MQITLDVNELFYVVLFMDNMNFIGQFLLFGIAVCAYGVGLYFIFRLIKDVVSFVQGIRNK